MAFGVSFKRELRTQRPKFVVGRKKVAESNAKISDRRRKGDRGNGGGWDGRYEDDGIGCDSGAYRRGKSLNEKMSYGGVKNSRSDREWGNREVDDRRRKGDRGNGGGRDGRYEADDIGCDGEAYRRGKSLNGKLSSGRVKNSRSDREWGNREVDVEGRFRVKGADKKRKRNGASLDEGEKGGSLDQWAAGGKSLSREGRFPRKSDAVGKSSKRLTYVKQIDSDEDRTNEEESNIIIHRASRAIGRKKEAVRDIKESCRGKDKTKNVEESSDRVKPNAKKRDGKILSEKCQGDVEECSLEKQTENKQILKQISKLKHPSNQEKLLDKSGKRIISRRKALIDDSVVTDDLPKKRKRVIRIDPHDISNKRIDDSGSTKEKVVEKEVELSKNAQFRAIKPTPSILSFVEDNLLGRRRLNELKNGGYNVTFSAPLDNIPFSTSPERERIDENVFRNKLEFFAAAKVSSSFPPPTLPEIAFAGRSNVGKSSLLNALTRQWGVVRTSDKPGYTQSVNFFRLAPKLCLVDLPGYGFAYAKEEVKDAWEELVKEYVSTREGLRRVCLLIDTKWGMKPRDHELIDLMERSQTPYQIVLTKTDAVFPMNVAQRAMQIEENLKANKSIINPVNPVMMVSSKSGAGIRSLRTVLAKVARFAKP